MMQGKFGFTVLEAVMVMAVMAAVTITVPAFYYGLRTQGVRLAAGQLRADLQQARILAINQRQTCSLEFHSPAANQYTNTLNRRISCLSGYRWEVNFLPSGPDGRAMGTRITFNRQGMSASAVATDLYLADGQRQSIYRVRVTGPGGIQIHRWVEGKWR